MISSQSFVAFSETLNFNSPASSVHGTIGPNRIKFLMQARKCDLSAVKNIPNLILATGTSYRPTLQSMGIANLNKSENLVTNTTAASKYLPKR